MLYRNYAKYILAKVKPINRIKNIPYRIFKIEKNYMENPIPRHLRPLTIEKTLYNNATEPTDNRVIIGYSIWKNPNMNENVFLKTYFDPFVKCLSIMGDKSDMYTTNYIAHVFCPKTFDDRYVNDILNSTDKIKIYIHRMNQDNHKYSGTFWRFLVMTPEVNTKNDTWVVGEADMTYDEVSPLLLYTDEFINKKKGSKINFFYKGSGLNFYNSMRASCFGGNETIEAYQLIDDGMNNTSLFAGDEIFLDKYIYPYITLKGAEPIEDNKFTKFLYTTITILIVIFVIVFFIKRIGNKRNE